MHELSKYKDIPEPKTESPATNVDNTDAAGPTTGEKAGAFFWSRGGGTLLAGAGTLAGGLATLALASNPIGWGIALGITLGIASGVFGVGVGVAQLTMSYGGLTTAKQDQELNQAAKDVMLLSENPENLVSGSIGVAIVGDVSGIRAGVKTRKLVELFHSSWTSGISAHDDKDENDYLDQQGRGRFQNMEADLDQYASISKNKSRLPTARQLERAGQEGQLPDEQTGRGGRPTKTKMNSIRKSEDRINNRLRRQ